MKPSLAIVLSHSKCEVINETQKFESIELYLSHVTIEECSWAISSV